MFLAVDKLLNPVEKFHCLDHLFFYVDKLLELYKLGVYMTVSKYWSERVKYMFRFW